MIVHDSVPADRIEKVVSQGRDKTLTQKNSPRFGLLSGIFLKDALKLRQQRRQQQQDSTRGTGKPVGDSIPS